MSSTRKVECLLISTFFAPPGKWLSSTYIWAQVINRGASTVSSASNVRIAKEMSLSSTMLCCLLDTSNGEVEVEVEVELEVGTSAVELENEVRNFAEEIIFFI